MRGMAPRRIVSATFNAIQPCTCLLPILASLSTARCGFLGFCSFLPLACGAISHHSHSSQQLSAKKQNGMQKKLKEPMPTIGALPILLANLPGKRAHQWRPNGLSPYGTCRATTRTTRRSVHANGKEANTHELRRWARA